VKLALVLAHGWVLLPESSRNGESEDGTLLATGARIRVIKTAVRAPNLNAIAERFAGSVRREALDHILVLDDDHMARIGREYAAFFNRARPHQGIGQRVPDGAATTNARGRIIAHPVLGGLHHDYRRAA
jgi:transposase InsO family protein